FVDGSFKTEEEMLSFLGSTLNRFTAVNNQEHMCNLYMLTLPDGTTQYTAGAIFTGEANNVITPYLKDMFGNKGEAYLSELYPDAKIDYLGMLHSHPQRWNGEDNDEFSWGDGLVSAISGRIYLSTPDGELYAPDRRDCWKVIPAGFVRDAPVSQMNNARKIKKTGNEHPGLRIAYLPFFKGAE
ncbi:MAG: hypothetical protein IJN00_01855, partial [Clostridia bacterium]|nr:hypothetical protein [Clostridia bacterium]